MSTTQDRFDAGLSARIRLTTALAMVCAAVLSLFVTLVGFGDGLRPQATLKAASVGAALQREIEAALALGIPFDALRGIDRLASETAASVPEVAAITVTPGTVEFDLDTAHAGKLVQTFADVFPNSRTAVSTVHPIVVNGQQIATLSTEIDRLRIAQELRNVFFDTLMILIATTLVSFELIAVMLGSALLRPSQWAVRALGLRARGELSQYPIVTGNRPITRLLRELNARNAALRARVAAAPAAAHALLDRYRLDAIHSERTSSVVDARIPLFLFCFAEELQKSFLPLFVAEVHKPGDLFGRDIMMGLPISVFMFVIAAVTPFAGSLVERYGNRRLFMFGLVPAVFGHVACAFATSGNDVVLGRALTAIGYAVITISCQSYIARVATAGNRAKSMAIFVGVLMTATLCGTAIGAILADWLGYSLVFLIAAALASIAGLLAYIMLDPSTPEPSGVARSAHIATRSDRGRNPTILLLTSPSFVTIILFCAIPTKIILTGFLYLFVPIYLAGLEVTQSEIGRIMMVYSLVIIPISPIASGFADRIGANLKIAVFASIASGIVLLGFLNVPEATGVLTIVAALGAAHAFLKAPLIVSVMEAAERVPNVPTTTALSLLRTCERIGSFVGPVLVATLMIHFAYSMVAVMVGAAVAASGLLLLAIGTRRAA